MESYALPLIIENVSMPAEEDEVSLIVESDNLTPVELRDWREEGNKEASDSVTETSSEIVEDEFGAVSRSSSVFVNFLTWFYR